MVTQTNTTRVANGQWGVETRGGEQGRRLNDERAFLISHTIPDDHRHGPCPWHDSRHLRGIRIAKFGHYGKSIELVAVGGLGMSLK